MDAANLPIGQSVVFTDTDYIKVVLTRVNHEKIISEHIDPKSGKTVLRARLGVYDGSSEIEQVDRDFWTITVDGKPIGPGAGSAQGQIQFDPRTRQLDIRTK